MPGHDFFERLIPRFALQAGEVKKTADRQADAERLISTAEYECVQMRPAGKPYREISERKPEAGAPERAPVTLRRLDRTYVVKGVVAKQVEL